MKKRLYTLAEAIQEFHLAFPSSEALKKYLARRRGIVGIRYVRDGRSTKRLLTTGEAEHLREIRPTHEVCQANSTGTQKESMSV